MFSSGAKQKTTQCKSCEGNGRATKTLDNVAAAALTDVDKFSWVVDAKLTALVDQSDVDFPWARTLGSSHGNGVRT